MILTILSSNVISSSNSPGNRIAGTGANLSLRDPNRGFTALEWAEFCGRRTCAEIIRNYLSGKDGRSSGQSRARRLSQAFSETEAWIKRLGKLTSSNASSPPTTPPTPPAMVTTTSSKSNNSSCHEESQDVTYNVLARTTAASALCTSLPILTGGVQTTEDQRINRILVIPSIYITPSL